MDIRNKLWSELLYSRTNIEAILVYCDNKRWFNRWYTVIISIIASLGTFGSVLSADRFSSLRRCPFWSMVIDVLPLFSSIGIILISLANEIIKKTYQTETDLQRIDKLGDFYSNHLKEIECLIFRLDNGDISETEAINRYYYIKSTEVDKPSQLNKYLHNISKKEQSIIDEKVKEYTKQYQL